MIFRSDVKRELWRSSLGASVISVATTPNCSMIAATTVGRELYLLNREGEQVWNSPKRLDHEGWAVAIARDATVIAVGTADKNPGAGSIYAFDSQGHQLLNHPVGAPVWGVDLSANGDSLVASSWDNAQYRFARNGQRYQRTPITTLLEASKGLYGIRLNPNGNDSVIAAYDIGLIIVDKNGEVKQTTSFEMGLYNLAIASGSNEIFAGCRDGRFLAQSLISDIHHLSNFVASRPLCGISVTQDGNMLFAGSFDGRAYFVDRTGKVLWSVETDGEVWSTACSSDGSLVCLGSGDHTVRLFENMCNTAAHQEIEAVEQDLSTTPEANAAKQLNFLVSLYLKYGLVEYGYRRIQQLSEASQHPVAYEEAGEQMLEQAILQDPDQRWIHFELGKLRKEENDYYRAAYHFQQAARDPKFYSQAMNLSAEAFARLELKTATSSCFRRAREQHLNSDAMRVLYNLGRSYEDSKKWMEALSCYELLVSWDAKYRNTWERLQSVKSILGTRTIEVQPLKVDYTGLTTSLLGPDTPRDVDAQLHGVIAARTAEVLLQPGERHRIANIVDLLLKNENYCRGITGIGLDYTTELFLKYDYALPEDETKKFLETVNLFYFLPQIEQEKKIPKTTLDIGSATGRYPLLFSWLGTKSARGIDIEQRAVEYATSKVAGKPGEGTHPHFEIGDAVDLPYKTPTFDFVTCMMGTFAHIPKKDHKKVIDNVYEALHPGGGFAISTWDLECEHLAFLSIYAETMKEEIRLNSPGREGMRTMLEEAGFQEVEIRPFCMLPQILIYDLGIAKLRSGDIQLAAQADLAVRALYPKKHGEMFIAFGKKQH